ncbi:hypothetical protein BJ165DRAFT_297815 [Panaeolus papilionaceus]|nr:hypothetical protein BJ165DRAFT_297815 [Panaeolus papilionaceus]
MREVSKEGENKGEEMKGKGKAKENEDIEEVQGKVEGEVEQGEAMEVDVEGAIELDTEMKEGERESDAVEGSKTKDGTKGEVGEKRPHSDEVEVVAEQEGTKHDEGAEPEAKKPKLGSDVGDKEEQRQKQGIGEESVEEHERTTTDHEDEGQKKSARTKQTAVKRGPGRPRKGSVAVKKAEAPVEPGKTRVKVKAREKN